MVEKQTVDCFYWFWSNLQEHIWVLFHSRLDDLLHVCLHLRNTLILDRTNSAGTDCFLVPVCNLRNTIPLLYSSILYAI